MAGRYEVLLTRLGLPSPERTRAKYGPQLVEELAFVQPWVVLLRAAHLPSSEVVSWSPLDVPWRRDLRFML